MKTVQESESGSAAGSTGPEDGARRHLARVAAKLFAARGYDATSVREIAEAAGVTKPTLYYHFGSKEGLAQALLNQPLEAFLGRLAAVLEEQEQEPRVMLERMVASHLEFCLEDPDRSRFVYALFFGPLGSGLAAEITAYADQIDDLMERATQKMVAAGMVEAARAKSFQQAIRGTIVIHTMDCLYRGESLSAELSCQLVRDLIEGFQFHASGKGRR